MISFRDVTIDDIEKIMILENNCFRDPWTKGMILEEIRCEEAVIKAVVMKDDIVGYGSFRLIFDEGHITTIGILPEYQGKGYGKKLLNDLINEGKRNGANAFTLEVRESNVKAIKIYEKSGFEVIGKRKNYYTSPIEDAIIMWRYNI